MLRIVSDFRLTWFVARGNFTPMTQQVQPPTDEAALFAEYRAALDAESEANAAKSRAAKAVEEIEYRIRDLFEKTGRWEKGVSAKASGVTVSVVEKARATYDPAKWPDVFKWAAANDLTFLIQRRLSDKAVAELVENGKALPEGLGIEYIKQLAFRRS